MYIIFIFIYPFLTAHSFSHHSPGLPTKQLKSFLFFQNLEKLRFLFVVSFCQFLNNLFQFSFHRVIVPRVAVAVSYKIRPPFLCITRKELLHFRLLLQSLFFSLFVPTLFRGRDVEVFEENMRSKNNQYSPSSCFHFSLLLLLLAYYK